jgi:signal transduction histidine kinase
MNKTAILCVDDEKTVLDSLKEQLLDNLEHQYDIETAEGGKEALEVFEELLEEHYEVPLIITDCIMPDMRGDELLQNIHARSPTTLKIMLTGQSNPDAVVNALNHADLYRYIAKPWETNDLILTVKEALKSYFQDQQIEKQHIELIKKNKELIQLHQDKNEFLGIVAHDLKNPLTAIEGLADMIEKSYDSLSQEDIMEMVTMIKMGSNQMFQLVQNLLDVNAIESGKMNLSLYTVDISPTVHWLINNYIDIAKAKNIALHVQNVEQPYCAYVDTKTVYQILDNLVSNALKYSPSGKNVYVRLQQNDCIVRCEIQDEGPGLSEADQTKLFHKFSRLTPRPTNDEHSTGLGLFIVKKLVEVLHGKVWCKSQLGQGTTFVVEFLKNEEKKFENQEVMHQISSFVV